jgi:ArsR family transcriptional regulator
VTGHPPGGKGGVSLDGIISLREYRYMRINNDSPLRQLTEAFKGLADPTRLRIMNLLLHGELCVCHIQRVLGASQPNVSRHLNYLKHSGLVLDRREGFRVYYRLPPSRGAGSKSLWAFLDTGFRDDAALRADLKRLKESKRAGAQAACPPFERGRQ